MPDREQLVEVFRDTIDWCRRNPTLAAAIQCASGRTRVWREDEYPDLPPTPHSDVPMTVSVTSERSFEAAQRLHRENPQARIAVHNFASATNPGGGVERGSRAQEESLCRTSTLYPILIQPRLRTAFYGYHKGLRDRCYTDRCIYSPGVLIIKSDDDVPQRLPESVWVEVDVITCAAPNLQPRPVTRMNPCQVPDVEVSDEELLDLHISRARHMLSVAAYSGAEILVLGAFGCGAFRNKPTVVAKAYQTVLPEFAGRFRRITFAVYGRPEEQANFLAFHAALDGLRLTEL